MKSRENRRGIGARAAASIVAENQKAQKGRTALTVIGGMIGVIAIALTLSVSNGLAQMVDSASKGTLRTTPITITGTTVNQQLAQIGSGSNANSQSSTESAAGDSRAAQKTKDGKPALSVKDTVADSLNASGTLATSGIYKNDLESLRKHIESDGSGIKSTASLVQYDYGLTPRLYIQNKDSFSEVYPSGGVGSLGVAIAGVLGSLLGAETSSSSFFTLPAEKQLYEDSYTVLAGRFPRNAQECLIVLDKDAATIDDNLLYQIGLLDHDELESMLKQALLQETVTAPKHDQLFTYDDLLKVKFKLVHPAAGYTQNARYGNWADMSSSAEYMDSVVAESPDVQVVGVVSYSGTGFSSLATGVGLSPDLQQYVIDTAKNFDVVKAQLQDTSRSVFTGKPFEGPGSQLTLADLGIAGMFTFDSSALMRALAGIVDMLEIPDVSFDFSMFEITDGDIEVALESLKLFGANVVKAFEAIDFSLGDMPNPPIEWMETPGNPERFMAWAEEYMVEFLSWFIETDESGYITYIWELTDAEYNEFVSSLTGLKGQLLERLYAEAGITDEAARQDLMDWYDKQLVPYFQTRADSVIKEATSALNSVLETALMNLMSSQFAQKITEVLGALGMLDGEFDVEKIMDLLSDVIVLDPNPSTTTEAEVRSDFSKVLTSNMGTQDISALVSLVVGSSQKSAEANLELLGMVDTSKPKNIKIFTENVEDRAAVAEYLKSYNEQMSSQGYEKKVIMFSDTAGSVLAPLASLVNSVGNVLTFPGILALIVFGLLLSATTVFDAAESRGRFAELYARGAASRSIFGIVFFQALGKGVAAVVFGILAIAPISLAASALVSKLVPNMTDVTFAVTFENVVMILLLCLVISALAALGPALRAKKNAVKDNALTATIPRV